MSCANQHVARRRDDALFLKMYGQRDIYGAGETSAEYDPDKLSFNLSRAVVSTAQAHIGSIRTKPRFQTSDANWSLSRRARVCEDAVKAIFYQQKYYDLATMVFQDAAVCSLGGIKIYPRDGEVQLERVYPGEILVDIRESYYGHPKNLYQVKLVDKYVLSDMFPAKEFDINRSVGSGREANLFGWLGYEMGIDQVLVVEGWHLPDGKGKGGRHVLSVRHAVLHDERWAHKTFPFAFYRWEERAVGFYGMGIVEELRAYQRSLNYLDKRIRDMIHFNSISKLVVPGAGKVNIEQLSNDPAEIIKIASVGERPFSWVANAVPPELFAERQRIIDQAFLQTGMNRMLMAGEKPAGITAAVALRELNDQGSKRFMIKVQQYEQLAVDTAKLIVTVLSLGESGVAKPIWISRKKRSATVYETVNWKDVALEPDEYRLEVQPASALPDSTAGRNQTVQDWLSAGLINVQEAKQLLEFPDLDAFQSLDLAPYHVILDAIESIVEDGEYVFPEPTDDLDLALKLATLSYSKFRLRKAPSDRLELLLQYVDDVKHWQEQAMMGANEMQQMAAGMAPAISGLQQQLPGGGNASQMAGLLTAGSTMRQNGAGMVPGPEQLPGGE